MLFQEGRHEREEEESNSVDTENMALHLAKALVALLSASVEEEKPKLVRRYEEEQ